MVKYAMLICSILFFCSFGDKKDSARAKNDLKGKVKTLREYKYGYTEGKLTHLDSAFYHYDKNGILKESWNYRVNIEADGSTLFRDRDRMYYQYADGKCVQRTDSTRIRLGYVMVTKYQYDRKGRLIFSHEYPTPDTTGVTNERITIAYSANGDTAIFEVHIKDDTKFVFFEKWKEVYDSKGQKISVFRFDQYLKTFGLSDTYSYDAAGNMIESNSYYGYNDSTKYQVRNEFDNEGRLIKRITGTVASDIITDEFGEYNGSSEYTTTCSYHNIDKKDNYLLKVSVGNWVDSTFRVIEYYP